MFDAMFESNSKLREYIDSNVKDPWVGTNFQGYVFMSPKQKGEFGERFVEQYFKTYIGSTVNRAPTSTDGFDRVIDGIATEIKFSLATRSLKTPSGTNDDTFIINHVSKDKSWERLVFFGINKELKSRLVWFAKEDFIKHHKEFFSLQQGGKKIENDDYMCTKVKTLIEQDWVKDLSEW